MNHRITRAVVAIVAANAVWLTVATLIGRVLRMSWPAYVAAEPMFAFTLPMLFARLAIGAVATVAGGWVAARISGRRSGVVLAQGFILLALFIPQHVMLFADFPLWYHAVFLASLVPLTWFGGRALLIGGDRQARSSRA